MCMSTLRINPERNPWYKDIDGCLTRTKDEDETINEIIDFTSYLESGETISAATWDDVSGPTITGTTVSSPTVTFTVTDSGTATLVTTTSLSRTLRRDLRWVDPNVADSSDYGN